MQGPESCQPGAGHPRACHLRVARHRESACLRPHAGMGCPDCESCRCRAAKACTCLRLEWIRHGRSPRQQKKLLPTAIRRSRSYQPACNRRSLAALAALPRASSRQTIGKLSQSFRRTPDHPFHSIWSGLVSTHRIARIGSCVNAPACPEFRVSGLLRSDAATIPTADRGACPTQMRPRPGSGWQLHG